MTLSIMGLQIVFALTNYSILWKKQTQVETIMAQFILETKKDQKVDLRKLLCLKTFKVSRH